MNRHAPLPPSGAPCWVFCYGWPHMNTMFPGGDTDDTVEGNAAHWTGAEMIHSHCRGKLGFPKLGATTPNGIVITEEIYQSAEVYYKDVSEVMDRTRIFGTDLFIEERVAMPDISLNNWGTSDLGLWDKKALTLYVWDYKHGHAEVPVFENYQLIDYVNGFLYRLSANGYLDSDITVVMRIVQPRCFHIDGPVQEWRINGADLRPYINRLRNAAQEIENGKADLMSGSHCRWCHARGACPAARKAALSLYEAVVPLGVEELSLEALGLQLAIVRRALEQLKSLDVAYSAQVEALLRKGAMVPLWILDSVLGHRKWKHSDEEIVVIGEGMGVTLYDKKPVTPAEAERRNVDKELIKLLTERPTSLKLKYDDGTAARRVFS